MGLFWPFYEASWDNSENFKKISHNLAQKNSIRSTFYALKWDNFFKCDCPNRMSRFNQILANNCIEPYGTSRKSHADLSGWNEFTQISVGLVRENHPHLRYPRSMITHPPVLPADLPPKGFCPPPGYRYMLREPVVRLGAAGVGQCWIAGRSSAKPVPAGIFAISV